MSKARPRTRARGTAAQPKHRSVRGPSPDSAQSPASGSPLSIAKAAFSGRALWVSLALIAANLIVYAPVRHYEFVTWDDPQYIYENPHVSGGMTWRGVSWAFTTGYSFNWHPLTWLSHMVDVQIYGMNAGPHHLTSVLLHIANTVLLFGLLHGMTGALGPSAFVAALFAVHPLHVESVAWVAERKDVLSTLFWMLTLCGYVRYVRQPRLGRYLVVGLLFALGLMAKPMLVTLPFVLLLLDYWPLGRMSLGDLRATRSIGRLVREKLPLLALAIASSIVTFVVQRRGGAVSGLDALPLNRRVPNALVSYFTYIGKMLWPTRLTALYPYPRSLPGWWVAGSILGLIGVSVVVIRAARHHPYLPTGWLWYLGTLVPVIGLVQVGSQSRADRYTYVPLIGLFIMVAWGVPDLLARWPYQRYALPTVAGLVILACTITARSQVQYWENSLVLMGHALEVTTDNFTAHNHMGAALADRGKVDEAIAHYSEALRIKPNFAEAHYSLGNALASQGKLNEAIAHYSEALRIKPGSAEPHNGLGSALADQRRFDEAVAHYHEALRIKPDFAEAHNNLGNSLASQGKVDEAIAHYSEALRIKPDFAEAYDNLGQALASQGRASEAIARYSEALRIMPGFAEAHINLALALANQGRFDEAIAHYFEALRIKPGYAIAHNGLGAALAKQGRVSEAMVHYSEALRIKPDYADAHYNLGIALANQGRAGEAIHEFSEALRINPGNPTVRRALDYLTSRDKRSGTATQ